MYACNVCGAHTCVVHGAQLRAESSCTALCSYSCALHLVVRTGINLTERLSAPPWGGADSLLWTALRTADRTHISSFRTICQPSRIAAAKRTAVKSAICQRSVPVCNCHFHVHNDPAIFERSILTPRSAGSKKVKYELHRLLCDGHSGRSAGLQPPVVAAKAHGRRLAWRATPGSHGNTFKMHQAPLPNVDCADRLDCWQSRASGRSRENV